VHRLPVLETVDASKFELPCAALRGVLCGIYEERPEECADFACDLLVRVEEERLSFDDAREIIETTRAIRSRVTAAIGATRWWTAHRSAIEAERSDPAWANENAELLADLKALKERVRSHFLGD
jgi:hypothetical protein